MYAAHYTCEDAREHLFLRAKRNGKAYTNHTSRDAACQVLDNNQLVDKPGKGVGDAGRRSKHPHREE
jgi:hypothetical protein